MSAVQLARVLRGDLDNIIAKALQKSPADRYATADAFAGDLQRYLNDEPVSARAESRAYRMRKFVRRHRLAVGAVASIVLVLVAGIAGTTWQAIERAASARKRRRKHSKARVNGTPRVFRRSAPRPRASS